MGVNDLIGTSLAEMRQALSIAPPDSKTIMRRAGTSKPTVWRWQERYLDEGAGGLKRDKTRPSRVPPLPRETRLKVIAKTVQESPPDATHWSRSLMAEAVARGMPDIAVGPEVGRLLMILTATTRARWRR